MRIIKSTFWNAYERRLRAGWRLLIQSFLFLIILTGMAAVINALGRGTAAVLVGGMLYLTAGLGMAWLLARFIDRRPFSDYGFHVNVAWSLDFGFGLLLGALLMTGIFLVEYLAGWISVTGSADSSSGLGLAQVFLLSFLVCLAVGVNEEFTFRGYELRNLAEGLTGRRIGPRLAILVALIVTSALFGLGHLGNPNATAISTIDIILGGFALSLPYLLTGELATPIGFHVSWNLFQGTIYGFPVSGSAPSRRMLVIEQGGPTLWTGGEFGPEAGLLGIVWVLLGCGLIVLWVKWRRKRLSLHVQLALYEGRIRETIGRHCGPRDLAHEENGSKK